MAVTLNYERKCHNTVCFCTGECMKPNVPEGQEHSQYPKNSSNQSQGSLSMNV